MDGINLVEGYCQHIEQDFNLQTDKIVKNYPIDCYDTNHSFKICKLFITQEIVQEKKVMTSNVSFFPIKTSVDSVIYYDIPFEISSIRDILFHILEILWKYQMCTECFYLIPPSTHYLCQYCFPSRLFWEYGIYQKYIDSVPICYICLEPVYKSRLECKHYIHRTCLIQMNPNEYFEENQEIQCPCCRQKITRKDKIDYFLI